MSQIYIEHDFTLRSDNGVLKATNGLVTSIVGYTNQIIDGTGSLQVLTTSIVPEGSNLYFTTARAQAAISGSAPISVSSGVVSITQANSTTNGYLSSTDWSTFNAKQPALNGTGFVKIVGTTISYDNSTYYLASNPNSYIPLTALSASAPLSYNNTTGAFTISQSGTTSNGYLSSTDWNTFNAKQNALGYTPVPNTRQLTINGVTYDLSADRTWTISFPVTSVFGRTGAVTAQSGDYTTTQVTEGTNLYFTNARAIGSTLTGYTSGSGTITSSDSILSAIQKLNGNVGLLTGAIIYQGTWNASTNTPTLTSGVGTKGYMYKVAVAGSTNIDGVTQWNVGDQLVFNGTVWDKIDGIPNEVLSVFGRVGAVTAQLGDYTTTLVTEGTNLYYTQSRFDSAFSAKTTTNLTEGTNLYFTNTRAQNAITLTTTGSSGAATYSGGTLNIPNYGSALSGYVPYTGATGNVNLGSYNLSLNALQFSSISAPSYSEGEVWYDSTQKALAYYNDVTNNILHIGQEVQLKVYNNTGSTIVKGAPVYITSTNSGFTYPLVALAKADTLTTSNVIGVANQDIPTSTAGYIVLSGLVSSISTGSYTVGTVLYLSPYSAGQLMSTVPPTGYAVRVGVVSYSNSPNGSIYINQSNAYSTAASIVGTIQISQGGTGATTAAGALTNLGAAASSRLISTTTPLQGGGDLSADRTLSILQAGTSQSGYLSSTDWNTFNNKQNALGYVPVGGSGSVNYISKFTGSTTISNSGIYEGVTNYVSIGNTNTTYNLDVTGTGRFTGDVLFGNALTLTGSSFLNSMTHIKQVSVMYPSTGYTTIAGSSTGLTLNTGGAYTLDLSFPTTASYTYTYPSASGTLALTSQLSGVIYGSGSTYQVAWFNATNSIGGSSNLYFDPTNNRLGINQSTPLYSLDVTGMTRITGNAIFGGTLGNGTYTYTLPSATGTLALTSNLSSYVPYSGATGSLYMGSSYLVSAKAFVTSGSGGGAYLKLLNALTAATPESDGVKLSSVGSVDLVISSNTYNSTLVTSGNTADRTYTFPNASGTIALTSNIPTLSGTAPISYSAGVISISQATNATNGYLTSTDWTTFNNKQAALSGTGLVKSTAGSITYITDNSSSWNSGSAIANSLNGVSPINFNSITGAISISQATTSTNGYLSSTDWNTFNNKQAALTNPVTGTGTTNYLSKFTGTSTIGSSLVYDNGSAVLIGTTTAGSGKFMVYSSTADNHIQAIGTAPSLRFAEAISTPSYTGIVGLATASNNFITGSIAGDMVLSNNTTSVAGNFLFGAGATERMRINGSTGYVSIGNTNNTYNLDVTGTGRFTGALTIAGLTSTGTISLTPSSFAVGSSTAVDANSLTLQAANSNYLLRFRNAAGTSLGGFYYDGTNFVADGPSWKFGNAAIFSSSVTAQGGSSSGFVLNYNSNASSRSWAMLNDQITFGDFCIQQSNTQTGTTRTTRLIIDGSGNVGIGTTSPRSVLQANGNIGMYVGSGTGTNGAQLYIGDSNFDNATYYNQAPGIGASYDATPGVAGALSFYTYNAAARRERMTITAPGNIGIGTTSPSYPLHLKNATFSQLYIEGGTTADLILYNSGGTANLRTMVMRQTSSSYLSFYSANDSGTINTNNILTLTNSGNVLIGTTTDNGQKFRVNGGIESFGSSAQIRFASRTASNVLVWYSTGGTTFFYNDAVGNISSINESTGIYTPLSDSSKKKDFEASTIGLNEVLQLKPTLFRMLTEDESSVKTLGFIAQEVQPFIPQAYVESGEGDNKFIGLNDRPIIAALVRAIQELSAELNELKSLINK